jgi:hypothetical protein
MADALRFYATEARKTTAGVDLLGETAPPSHKILAEAKSGNMGKKRSDTDGAPRGGATHRGSSALLTETETKAKDRKATMARGRPMASRRKLLAAWSKSLFAKWCSKRPDLTSRSRQANHVR